MSFLKSLMGLMLVSASISFFSHSVFAQTLNPTNIYVLHCSGCHGVDGSGSRAGGIPNLNLVKTFTSDTEGRTYLMQVPGIAYSSLSNKEVASVLNYAVERWGQPNVPFNKFTFEEIAHLRAIEIADIVSYRRNLAARYEAQGKPVAEYPWP
jgi:hypothetical protein